jgi:hypothetical protein
MYFKTELFFASCGILASCLGIWVLQLDEREHGGVLERPAIQHPSIQPQFANAPLWEAPAQIPRSTL